jgi:hypothetical protein
LRPRSGRCDQLPTPRTSRADEGVGGEDFLLDVVRQEACAHVVARDAEGGLREVVGAEREELGASAISSAVTAARGSSIMVPTR